MKEPALDSAPPTQKQASKGAESGAAAAAAPSAAFAGPVLQVQQAVQEANAQALTAAQQAGKPSTPGGALLEEGSEVYLLYVKFRAAAEPGLKGGVGCEVHYCAWVSGQWQSLECKAAVKQHLREKASDIWCTEFWRLA
jgi:hypothetical protein